MRLNRSVPKDSPPPRPWKLLLWAAAASLALWALQIGYPLENALRVVRNSIHPTEASGQIVLVGVDDESLREIGSWPWPRTTQAKIIDAAREAGADRLFFDFVLGGPTKPDEDRAFAAALERAGNVTLAVRDGAWVLSGLGTGPAGPIEMFARHTQLASISIDYDYQGAAWYLRRQAPFGGREVPTFAAAMAGGDQRFGSDFLIDYSIEPGTIPYVSAADLIKGRVSREQLRGKTLLYAANSEQIGDRYWIPGSGRMAGGYILALGAETLKSGRPRSFGFVPAFLLTFVTCAIALGKTKSRVRALVLATTAGILLGGPILFDMQLLSFEVVPSLFLLSILCGRLGYLHWRNRGLVNNSSGLPNLEALRASKETDTRALIAARVHNYAEIASTLQEEEEAELARQVVARLTTGGSTQVYQGDEGVFIWLTDAKGAIGNHLEALHAIFRSPVTISARQIDIALSFGVELGSARSLGSRLGSALVAADEAWEEGLKWKLHDPARQEEASWRLSLLGELDTAIDNGEVWIAYQPQYDLRCGTIIGAEALARWTHPEKGPISPSEFVAAAEAQGRISKLTDFVLDRAIAAAAAINRRGVSFQIAVNLSARMLSDRQLLDRIDRMLRAHGLPAGKLTLELTETATLQGPDNGLAVLDAIRRMGIRIAIDDYGTGLSTLEYLKKVPADEIKIDQSFVKAMRVNRSDLIMVQSTIALAQSLGRLVIAEGVEDRQCLEDLEAMGCDVAQGFAIGRPMGVRELVQRLPARRARRVA